MGRKIGAIGAGILVAFTFVAFIEYIGHLVYPVPDDLDLQNQDAFKKFVADLPLGALLFVIAAWVIGAVGGSIVAGVIAGQPTMIYTVVVTGIVLLASIINMVAIPHPIWFSVTAVVLLIASVWLAESALQMEALNR